MVNVKTLVELNNNWGCDTELTFVSNDGVPFRTVDIETLYAFYPLILKENVQYFENNMIYLK